jgi:hypothetical protein
MQLTYALVTLFLVSGQTYVEQRGLSLATCAGRLALLRTATLHDLAAMESHIGQVQYRCVPEGRS